MKGKGFLKENQKFVHFTRKNIHRQVMAEKFNLLLDTDAISKSSLGKFK